jgi:hypothetical protein
MNASIAASVAVACAGTVLMLSTSGCNKSCDTVGLPAIRLLLVDSTSGGALMTSDIIAVANAGSFRDSVRLGSIDAGRSISLGVEKAGTYRVEVTALGYRQWVRDGIRVTEGDCNVRTVEVVARLQRL